MNLDDLRKNYTLTISDQVEWIAEVIDLHENSDHAAREILSEIYKHIAECWTDSEFLKKELIWFAEEILVYSYDE